MKEMLHKVADYLIPLVRKWLIIFAHLFSFIEVRKREDLERNPKHEKKDVFSL